MSDSHDETLRDQLPLLRAGALSAADAAALRAHLAGCAACTAELALLERTARLFEAATPRVDVSAILAKLPAPPAMASRPALRVERGGTRVPRIPRYALAAAASLVLVATLSFAALQGRVFGPSTPGLTPGDTAPDIAAAAVAAAPVALVGAAELESLGASELETLLDELDRFEATIAAEPLSLQRPVVGAPEGL